MMRFIDFIRHGDATGPSDRTRVLNGTGLRQAISFGKARMEAGENYDASITSGLPRTNETALTICGTMQDFARRHLVPELFDPEQPTAFSKERTAAYTELGAAPLFQYRCFCRDAMSDIGTKAGQALTPLLSQVRGNILVVGHQVYTNEIILALSYFEDDDQTDEQRSYARQLLHDPAITGCAGYRLVLNEQDQLIQMIKLLEL